ncbi:response regulator [Glycomyces harbinensis]|uniref:DNA-binding response regulator, NarL/FixJ family, contains REC and HTH domains n=1 Tax=Glycomyces harbinensis TaxID=58114 RepID=A0A1G7AP83_9ACTN|nr:response regulator transcription factor [Glycomyces harbinensis]SDE16679.1 DNA-binding response regulator, NarL/FixJ family, contains REC and HTH domains [Glycomyces harbinensis]
MIRVCLVDDQHLVRHGIRRLLDLCEDVEVVAEADDGMAALSVIAETRPDVVLLDLRMPRHDGIWTLNALRDSGIDVPVLVLTTFDDDELVLGAIQAGARGYLLKDVTLQRLVAAVSTLAEGGTLLRPAITDRLLRSLQRIDDPALGVGEALIQPPTDRERDVLRLLAAGFSNREIAEALFLAEGTVKNHVSSILAKLGTRDRTRAVLRALHHGLLD